MMRGGAIQLLLPRILVVAVLLFALMMMNVTFRCKKMEIADIVDVVVVADDVF